MKREHLAAFREALTTQLALRRYTDRSAPPPTLEYMRAVRRLQRAFGLPGEDDRHWTADEWSVWKRLHGVLFAWADRLEATS